MASTADCEQTHLIKTLTEQRLILSLDSIAYIRSAAILLWQHATESHDRPARINSAADPGNESAPTNGESQS